ncbi:hypothetical protein MIR68_002391 [Amoeboaphelidium protococcarum]|nr:hypothetical protein MIR68_002391 [Amoeboaphelidium protococcarum]
MKVTTKTLDPKIYKPLPDYLSSDLDIVFSGDNPGAESSLTQHHYAHKSNMFWTCLNQSGILPDGVKLSCHNDYECPEKYRIGLTNIAKRPTREANHLTKTDYRDGFFELRAKLELYRPKIVAFVGRGIYKVFLKHWQDTETSHLVLLTQQQCQGKKAHVKIADGAKAKIIHRGFLNTETIVYVLPSTSGRCAIRRELKVDQFKQLNKTLRAILEQSNEL